MDAMQAFHDIAADPQAYAREWKARTGGKVIGTLCSYAPEELILASGALGYRIVGGSGAISKADAHLQAYSCSLVRGAMEDALNNRLDFLDGTVFPHTCDSIQRLSDLWRLNVPTGFHLDVVLVPNLVVRPESLIFRSDEPSELELTLENEGYGTERVRVFSEASWLKVDRGKCTVKGGRTVRLKVRASGAESGAESVIEVKTDERTWWLPVRYE